MKRTLINTLIALILVLSVSNAPALEDMRRSLEPYRHHTAVAVQKGDQRRAPLKGDMRRVGDGLIRVWLVLLGG